MIGGERVRLSIIGWAALGILAALLLGGWLARDTVLLHWAGWRAPKVGPPRSVEWERGPQVALAAPAERPPNIVLIVADDLGFNDISLNGGGRGSGTVKTPNIDAIAHEGVILQSAYATHASSGPSRAGLMTGRYPQRFGFESTPVPALMSRMVVRGQRDQPLKWTYHSDRARGAPRLKDMGMPADEVTMAEVLAGRGYHTVHLGKWALGAAKGMRPEDQGFNESLGFMAAAQKYALPDTDGVVNARLNYDPTDKFLWANLPFSVQYNGSAPFRPHGYMTDYLTDQAVKVIDANRNRPLFLYVAYNAPHTPLQALAADYQALDHIKDQNERVYAAMIVALDRGVGRIMQALKDQGLDDNTLVVFTSDNGGTAHVGIEGLNAPYRGWKMTFFDGGIRVPMFVRWPSGYGRGQVAQPVSHLDLFATVAAVAGASTPTDRIIDGVDLTPFLKGQSAKSAHEALYWRNGGYRAVRSGKWKLQTQQSPRRIWLHNLEDDPGETHNLASTRRDVVDYMTTLLQIHDQQQAAPLWPSMVDAPVPLDKSSRQRLEPGEQYVVWAN